MNNQNSQLSARRTERVATNLSVAELGIIKLRMEERGIKKVSDYLRLMALGSYQYPVLEVPEVNSSLVSLLTGTMSNINQLARVINTYGSSRAHTARAEGLKNNLSKLLHRSITALTGQLDYEIVKTLCTEMLDTQDLELILDEHRKRNAV